MILTAGSENAAILFTCVLKDYTLYCGAKAEGTFSTPECLEQAFYHLDEYYPWKMREVWGLRDLKCMGSGDAEGRAGMRSHDPLSFYSTTWNQRLIDLSRIVPSCVL